MDEREGGHGGGKLMGLWMAPLMFSVRYTRRCRIEGCVMTMIASVSTPLSLHQPNSSHDCPVSCMRGRSRSPSHKSVSAHGLVHPKVRIAMYIKHKWQEYLAPFIITAYGTVLLPWSVRLTLFSYFHACHSPSLSRRGDIS